MESDKTPWMTVATLIEHLQKLDPTLAVAIWNRRAGVPERFSIKPMDYFGFPYAYFWPTQVSADGNEIIDALGEGW